MSSNCPLGLANDRAGILVEDGYGHADVATSKREDDRPDSSSFHVSYPERKKLGMVRPW